MRYPCRTGRRRRIGLGREEDREMEGKGDRETGSKGERERGKRRREARREGGGEIGMCPHTCIQNAGLWRAHRGGCVGATAHTCVKTFTGMNEDFHKLQGYLAHKKTRPRPGPPQDPRHRRTVGSYRVAVSYRRGTPVGVCG